MCKQAVATAEAPKAATEAKKASEYDFVTLTTWLLRVRTLLMRSSPLSVERPQQQSRSDRPIFIREPGAIMRSSGVHPCPCLTSPSATLFCTLQAPSVHLGPSQHPSPAHLIISCWKPLCSFTIDRSSHSLPLALPRTQQEIEGTVDGELAVVISSIAVACKQVRPVSLRRPHLAQLACLRRLKLQPGLDNNPTWTLPMIPDLSSCSVIQPLPRNHVRPVESLVRSAVRRSRAW